MPCAACTCPNCREFKRSQGATKDAPESAASSVSMGNANSMSMMHQINAENALQSLFDSIRDYAIIYLDASGQVTSWNAGAERVLGYLSEEALGMHFSRFYREEDRLLEKPRIELETAAGTGRWEEEGVRVRKDGTTFVANIVVTPIRGADGELRGFAKITRDITQRVIQAEALKKSEEQLRMLFDSIRDYAIIYLDASGQVTSWNAGAERVLGYLSEEALGMHFSRFYREEDRLLEKPRIELETAAGTGRWEEEGVRVRKDGTTFVANIVVTPIRGADGELRGFAKITRDITQRVIQAEALAVSEIRLRGQNLELQSQVAHRLEIEANLISAKNAAQAALQAKSEFLSNMSHELRTPLNAVIGLSYILADTVLTAEQERAVSMIADSSSLLLRIINDILEVSNTRLIERTDELHRLI